MTRTFFPKLMRCPRCGEVKKRARFHFVYSTSVRLPYRYVVPSPDPCLCCGGLDAKRNDFVYLFKVEVA